MNDGAYKVYICGAITGDVGHRVKFQAAEDLLISDGHKVMNPAWMPDGFTYEEYMNVSMAMLAVCNAIYLLPCYKESPGALREIHYAQLMGKVFLGTQRD